MKGFKIFSLQLIVFFLPLFCQASVIVLKDKVEVKGPNIFLGEIAILEGGASCNLYNLCIGKAPLPGRVRTIDKRWVNMKLKHIGREDIVTGAERVEVTTSYQLLDEEEIINVVRRYLLKRIDGKYSIEIVRAPSERVLPKGKVELIVSPIEDIIGYYNVSVIIKVDGEEYERCKVGVRVRKFKDVVVTNNRLKRHHILTREDVMLEEKDITNIRGKSFFEIEEVIGKRANNFLPKGAVLTSSLISDPPIIEKGDIVRIKSEIGLISVSTLGKAIQSGRLDEKIKAKNLYSKKIIEGRVRDKYTIVVK